jgi:hypothetical protein
MGQYAYFLELDLKEIDIIDIGNIIANYVKILVKVLDYVYGCS